MIIIAALLRIRPRFIRQTNRIIPFHNRQPQNNPKNVSTVFHGTIAITSRTLTTIEFICLILPHFCSSKANSKFVFRTHSWQIRFHSEPSSLLCPFVFTYLWACRRVLSFASYPKNPSHISWREGTWAPHDPQPGPQAQLMWLNLQVTWLRSSQMQMASDYRPFWSQFVFSLWIPDGWIVCTSL